MRLCAGSILSLVVLFASVGPAAAHPQGGFPMAQQPGMTQQQDDRNDGDILLIGAISLGILMVGTIAALALTRHGMRSSNS